ncbi:MAG: iron hydrogenase small subunit [Spirochaetes bacterium]|nr:iron hydrogenase small subunit [Spirochaetota bacterium]MBN2771860.1 iron hydrogenase small subunit [Spirochaetota bacterium]
METVNVKFNGKPYEVQKGLTILKAAEAAQIKIPKLCDHPDLEPWAACGLCIVKLENSPKMFRSCAMDVQEGMSIITHDSEIVQVRKTVLELILSRHPNDCLKCGRNGNCELQNLAADFGIREVPYPQMVPDLPKDTSTSSIVLDPSKCVLCGRCAQVCQNMQNVWALEFLGRGFETRIAPAADVDLADSPCVKCGQCSAHCPVGAIYEKDQVSEVWNKINNQCPGCQDIYPVVQIAPAVRVAIGEAFGYEPGEISTGKLYAALRRLGFKAVFDTNFSADLTILEEGTEFVKRFTSNEKIPLITSCCPAWIDYLEKYDHDMIDHFSTAKSPQEMMGAMIKTYYAEQQKVDASKIYSVSVMPCTAKKFECDRNEDMFSSGYQDVDVVLTTRELARMMKQAGIDFAKLEDEKADEILAEYTGAGTIFGATGGVMEAALRSAYFLITKEELPDVNLVPVRGLDGVKEATIDIKGTSVNVAVAHGLVNVEYVLDKVRDALAKGEKSPYDFIEVMACRGGCVGGGGQPYGATDEIRAKRAAGMYKDDEQSEIRCSHQNPMITKIYKDFLGEPGSHKAHKLLHTSYKPRKLYNK